jgi:AcrR family transcriptional regulator
LNIIREGIALVNQSATKEKIFQAALSLFNSKGYSGTSMREIAKAAGVNVSTIFYYYSDKGGLLEYCFVTYFEEYINILEKGMKQLESADPSTILKKIIHHLLDYQYQNYQLSRFVCREVSIDSQIVRETMTTYFRKERYLLQTIIEKGIEAGVFRKLSAGIVVIQLKGMLNQPFLNSIYTSEVWNIYFQDRYYIDQYKKQLEYWVDVFLSKKTSPVEKAIG